jgi:PII-like signaling protein
MTFQSCVTRPPRLEAFVCLINESSIHGKVAFRSGEGYGHRQSTSQQGLI